MYTKRERKRIINKLAFRVARGESLNKLCERDEYPSRDIVIRWIIHSKEFSTIIAHARGIQVETFVDQMQDIIDEAVEPVIIDGQVLRNDDGTVMKVATPASVAHAKLKIDTIKWIAGQLKPSKYGKASDVIPNTINNIVNLPETPEAFKLLREKVIKEIDV